MENGGMQFSASALCHKHAAQSGPPEEQKHDDRRRSHRARERLDLNEKVCPAHESRDLALERDIASWSKGGWLS